MISNEQKEQIKAENKKILDNLTKIKHRIVVFSGKGGVGKTTVSVNLAYGLNILGNIVGILDADVTGPNVPKMLGMKKSLPILNGRIVPLESKGIKFVSIANMVSPEQPVIWRGPMRSKLLNQFLADVEWGQLDYLVADLPPGTGDEILTMTQNMHPDLAVIVTTPQEVSLIDSRRAVSMARKMEIKNIAIIENMSGLICPKCGYQIDLFGIGGGQRQAEEMNVMFLGALPINIKARRLADEGKSIIMEDKKADISIAILDIVKKINEIFKNEKEKSIA